MSKKFLKQQTCSRKAFSLERYSIFLVYIFFRWESRFSLKKNIFRTKLNYGGDFRCAVRLDLKVRHLLH